jgi:hypothetical protein
LGFDVFKLEEEFDRWQRTRTTEARRTFDDMLLENSFIEFWGRLSKLGGEGVDGGVKRDDDGDEDEGEGGGGNVDMKRLAKTVDITEMEKVLKVRAIFSLGPSYLSYSNGAGRQAIYDVRSRSRAKGTVVAGTLIPNRRMNLTITQIRITCRDYPLQSCLYTWEK